MAKAKSETKLVVVSGFSACEDGCVVTTYEPGEYENLPPIALEHGVAIGAFDEASEKDAKEIVEALKAEAKAKAVQEKSDTDSGK